MQLKLAGYGVELKADRWRGLATLLGGALIAASVLRELRLPPRKRTWHGRLFGKVPYDLRPPDPRRLLATIWNPASGQVLVPTWFGIGWTFNLAALRRLFSSTS
jgi:hypothetical protein